MFPRGGPFVPSPTLIAQGAVDRFCTGLDSAVHMFLLGHPGMPGAEKSKESGPKDLLGFDVEACVCVFSGSRPFLHFGEGLKNSLIDDMLG